MRIISAYTTDPLYSNMAVTFKKNMDTLGYKYSVYPYISQGTWVLNTRRKPSLILQALLEHQESVVWVDIDCKFLKYVDFPESNTISGCWEEHYSTKKLNLWSTVMFFPYNPTTINILGEWIDYCKTDTDDIPDDAIFDKHKAEWEEKYQIKFEIMNPDFYQFDIWQKRTDPSVVQTRASRHKLRKHRVRITDNGILFLVRKNKETEKYLDQYYDRVDTLKWRPRTKDWVAQFTDLHKGETVTVIGKGPSATYFNKEQNTPIVCINDSIFLIEKLVPLGTRPLYCVLQDQNALKGKLPRHDVTIFCSQNAHPLYCNIQKAYSFYFEEYNDRTITVIIALKILHIMGVRSVDLYGFDSFYGNTDYITDLGYPSSQAGVPSRFLSHPKRILETLQKLDLTYQVARLVDGASDGMLQPLLEHN